VTPAVVALVLFAAVLHASWNAVLRSGADRLWAITVMSYATTAVAAPFALILPLPQAPCWPFLIASVLLQTGYSVFLAFAYHHGELGQVYPMVRGGVPLMVTLGGLLFAGERLGPPAILGVLLISTGVVALSFGRGRASPKSIALALGAGAFVAAYVTVDGIGVRRAGDAGAYAAWIFLAFGAAMPLAFRLMRGGFAGGVLSREGLKAVAGGVVSLVSYGAVLLALATGPLGPIAALRETSIVVSVLLGRLALKEALTLRRVLACATVALGAVVIAGG
jgi:drug/metabolite transporter (DMT)-like permease